MTSKIYPDMFIRAIGEATFSDYDPERKAHLNKARTVMLALPEGELVQFADIGATLASAPIRGMGPVTAFEVLVALGRLLESA